MSYTGWIEGVGYLAANPSIDWAVARKKGNLIYASELLEIPPVFEDANAQNRPVPRAQVVDAKSFYGEKGRGRANSGGNALLSGASTTGSVWDMIIISGLNTTIHIQQHKVT